LEPADFSYRIAGVDERNCPRSLGGVFVFADVSGAGVVAARAYPGAPSPDRLRTRGWLVPAYTMPANRQDMAVQRILVRQGFSRDLAALLMDDYRVALDHFEAHPVTTPLTETEAGSFNHGHGLSAEDVHRASAGKRRAKAST
jgi:glutamate/tyrosine decarboxylase-like PLP-dependent enzyme